jgi:hypothetical protein
VAGVEAAPFLLDSLAVESLRVDEESFRVDEESLRVDELSPVAERFEVLVELEVWLVDDEEPDAGVMFDNM